MTSDQSSAEVFLTALSMDDNDEIEFPRMDFEPRLLGWHPDG